MKIILSIPTNHLLLPDAAMPLVPLLVNATPVTTNGYGKDQRYIENENGQIDVTIVRDDQLGERPDPMQTLMDERRATSERWLKEYHRADELDKKVKDLEAKLAAMVEAAE